MDVHTQNKALIAPLRAAMYDFDAAGVRAALGSVCTPDVLFRFCHPFGDLTGVEAFYDAVYAGLFKAWPDLERRDTIVIAGPDEFGNDWVGAGGYYTGVFTAPWLDIPPSGHQVSMRFHEFYRIVDGKVVEVQALWDIPEVMMQANAWPMAPSLGREWHVPGPATQDGLVPGPYDAEKGAATCQHIIDMLEHLKKHPAQGGPEVMEMERFWHPRMNWYGPSGIGTGRGIAGFRNWHQIPFLNGMPDRGQYVDEINYHFFGDGDYAAVTGWPNMIQTVTHDGWMGIAPAGRKITMRSLDFWRLENGKIRENWVLVDLLDAYAQLGVDVFARLREFNKARNLAPINIPNGMS
ncbi:ester cyclase [Tritonibacter scottomollicae]|uniref:Ester cyclase n=1 Tax=Tritonibacter scottomollicae TaxID=483013 RepID=A0ABZ0HHB3_TRISK|nr:ester cyclase [Tritonibacter scottomollicae]WOI33316.1 ester cyclase [Tritonibacter scottomollicae]